MNLPSSSHRAGPSAPPPPAPVTESITATRQTAAPSVLVGSHHVEHVEDPLHAGLRLPRRPSPFGPWPAPWRPPRDGDTKTVPERRPKRHHEEMTPTSELATGEPGRMARTVAGATPRPPQPPEPTVPPGMAPALHAQVRQSMADVLRWKPAEALDVDRIMNDDFDPDYEAALDDCIEAAGQGTPRPALMETLLTAVMEVLADSATDQLRIASDGIEFMHLVRELGRAGGDSPAIREALFATVVGAVPRLDPHKRAFLLTGLQDPTTQQAQSDLAAILAAPALDEVTRGALAWGLALRQDKHPWVREESTNVLLSDGEENEVPYDDAVRLLTTLAAPGGAARQSRLAHALLTLREHSEMDLRQQYQRNRTHARQAGRPFEPSASAKGRLDLALGAALAPVLATCTRRQRFEWLMRHARNLASIQPLPESEFDAHVRQLMPPAPPPEAESKRGARPGARRDATEDQQARAALEADIARGLRLDPTDILQVAQIDGLSAADRIALMERGGSDFLTRSAKALDRHLGALAAAAIDPAFRARLLSRLITTNHLQVGARQLATARSALVKDILRAGDDAAQAEEVPPDDGKSASAAGRERAQDQRESQRSQAMLEGAQELVDLYRGWLRSAAPEDALAPTALPERIAVHRRRLQSAHDTLDAEREALQTLPGLWACVKGGLGEWMASQSRRIHRQIEALTASGPSSSSSSRTTTQGPID